MWELTSDNAHTMSRERCQFPRALHQKLIQTLRRFARPFQLHFSLTMISINPTHSALASLAFHQICITYQNHTSASLLKIRALKKKKIRALREQGIVGDEIRSNLSGRTLAGPEPSSGETTQVYTDHTKEETQSSWSLFYLETILPNVGDLAFQNLTRSEERQCEAIFTSGHSDKCQ